MAKPYHRNTPPRMKCIASASRPLAKSFHFGEAAVTAEMSTLHQCVLSDGRGLFHLTLPEGKEDVVVLDQTYVFKNLVVKDSRAFYNENTISFKSYPMHVSPELVDQASRLLLPPSHPVNIRDVRGSCQTYLTIEGQVTSMLGIRQVRLKGSPVPILELKLQAMGEDLLVSFWREAALTKCEVGDWLRITHVRKPTNTSFGYKMSTSAYTEVTKIESSVTSLEVTIIGAQVGEMEAILLTDTGSELKVPGGDWRGTEGEFLLRLPLTQTVDIKGDVITSPEKLFADQPTCDEELGEDLGEDLIEDGALEEALEGLEGFLN